MTQENKKLLLQDLCARLPYGVKIELMPIIGGICTMLTPIILHDYFISDYVNYLPYLRPMSSMTEEEEKDFRKFQLDYSNITFDWLNSHYFGFRNLIGRGLAIEVTEENNPYK